MASVQTFSGSKILIQIGDGADPENFSRRCSINASRSIQGTASMVETTIPDCDDEEKVAWVIRDKDSVSYTISGEGVHAVEDISFFTNWLKSEQPKNIIALIASDSASPYQLTGRFHLTDYTVSGERKQRAQASLSLVSTEEVTSGTPA